MSDLSSGGVLGVSRGVLGVSGGGVHVRVGSPFLGLQPLHIAK